MDRSSSWVRPAAVGSPTHIAPGLEYLDQVVARAQALRRKLLAGQTGASVDHFLADRARKAAS
jgi:hypothetical protein